MKGNADKSRRKIEMEGAYWLLFGQACSVLPQRENSLRKYRVSKV